MEIEEDPLQKVVDMLLAGGYFRARISSLSPFDKIVGGMAWAVTAANEEVEIEYDENAKIGQKIAVSEQLIKALIRMRCPHPLQPHQIQGLDYEQVYPVIQWLVKKVIEVREEMGDVNRQYSVMKYDNSFDYPETIEKQMEEAKVVKQEARDKKYGKVMRRFRRTKPIKKNEELRVFATLMEYGVTKGLFGLKGDINESEIPAVQAKREPESIAEAAAARSKKKKEAAGAQTTEEQEENLRKAKEQHDEVMQRMSVLEDQGDQVSGTALGNMIDLTEDELRAAFEKYQQVYEEHNLGANVEKAGRAAEESHVLKRNITEKEEQIAGLTTVHEEEQAKIQKGKKMIAKREAKIEEISEKIAGFDSIANEGDNASILEQLRTLISHNEALKSQETTFRKCCKQQMTTLTERIAKLEALLSPDTLVTIDEDETDPIMLKLAKMSKEKEKYATIDKAHGEAVEKLNKLRVLHTKKGREISAVTRKVDEIPVMQELDQYKLSFNDLYEQIDRKLVETRKYYAAYNTISDKVNALEKQVKMLESVRDQFTPALKSSSIQKKYLESFQQILDAYKGMVARSEKKLSDERAKRDEMHKQYTDLVEKERNYYRSIQKFKEECDKAEKLRQEYEAL